MCVIEAYFYLDPVLKEAAANAAGTNASLPSSSSGGATPIGGAPVLAEGDREQEMKDNSETVQNPGSQ